MMKIDAIAVLPPHGGYNFRLLYHVTVNKNKTLCGRRITKEWKVLSDEERKEKHECGNCWGARRAAACHR